MVHQSSFEETEIGMFQLNFLLNNLSIQRSVGSRSRDFAAKVDEFNSNGVISYKNEQLPTQSSNEDRNPKNRNFQHKGEMPS